MVVIKDGDDLSKMGAIAAYQKVRAAGINPSLNLLYEMDAGLRDMHWKDLSLKRRMELETAVNFRKDLK